jgi:hypothetical protein
VHYHGRKLGRVDVVASLELARNAGIAKMPNAEFGCQTRGALRGLDPFGTHTEEFQKILQRNKFKILFYVSTHSPTLLFSRGFCPLSIRALISILQADTQLEMAILQDEDLEGGLSKQ